MRVAIYARVSTSDRRQDPESQLEQLRQFAASQRWEVAGEYIDYESGRSADRAQFQRLFEDASRRRFDVVLFWALDRFSREGALPTLQQLNQLTSYGVQFRSFTEQYLDSCGIFREAVISILAVIAKQERIRMSERTRAGLERARAQGKKIGRPTVEISQEDLAKLAAARLSVSAIARQLSVSRRTAARRLKDAAIEILPPIPGISYVIK
jgi:DNA invertase Pin-like site-specific DNA recombinase